MLQGKLEIYSGSEAFLSNAGPFTYLGIDVLTCYQDEDDEGVAANSASDLSAELSGSEATVPRVGRGGAVTFVPNFTAKVVSATQLWQITRRQYDMARQAVLMRTKSGRLPKSVQYDKAGGVGSPIRNPASAAMLQNEETNSHESERGKQEGSSDVGDEDGIALSGVHFAKDYNFSDSGGV